MICRPRSLEEWSIDSKLWRLQAHLIGYVPQSFAWGLIIAQFLEAGGASTTDASGATRQMPTFVYGIVFGEVPVARPVGVIQLATTYCSVCRLLTTHYRLSTTDYQLPTTDY